MIFADLPAALARVCPIRTFSGRGTDRSTWTIEYADGATPDQRTAAQALIDACSVDAPAPRAAPGSALRDALKAQGWDAAWTAAMVLQSDDTRAWWVSAYRDQVPITATKLVRIAGACVPKVDLDKLYTAAGA